ncbi:MAG: hypothetical protein IJY61_00515 [Candidatus Gastranaerophilales bacterium]|nr:hypothetical protein [Candidatus Gastranaerophilales bacterium]
MKINSINTQYQLNTRRTQNNKTSQNQQNPSFGGVKDVIAEPLSNFYDKVASNGKFQKFVTKFSRTNSFTHLMVAESCFLSGFYMINTLRNKKIKKEQKPQMLINDAMTLGVSTAGAYLLDDKVSGVVTKVADNYFKNNKDFYIDKAKDTAQKMASSIKEEIGAATVDASDDAIAAITKKISGQFKGMDKSKAFQITADKLDEVTKTVATAIKENKGSADKAKEAVAGTIDDIYGKLAGKMEADKIMPGINKIKTLVIFGIIYRYLGPVLVTPLANKLSSKFFDKKKPEEQKTQQAK